MTSALTINGVAYTLVGDVNTLRGLNFYVTTAVALARDYDASGDGTYADAPIGDLTSGAHLEGLGHTLSHLNVSWSGFIDYLHGTLTNLHLAETVIYEGHLTGSVANNNYGLIDHVSVTGTLLEEGYEVGGLVGENDFAGVVRNSSAKIKIPFGGYMQTGGLVGVNYGLISNSWTVGTVRGMGYATDVHGGLVGFNGGTIENSYSLADTRFCDGCKYEAAHGGLIGETSGSSNYPSKVISSYIAGRTAPPPNPSRGGTSVCSGAVINLAGAVAGCDGDASSFISAYWVTDSSRHNPKKAAGNKAQLGGVTGLTEAQLKAALPPGFDPKVWAIDPKINNGYPYLLANPPQ